MKSFIRLIVGVLLFGTGIAQAQNIPNGATTPAAPIYQDPYPADHAAGVKVNGIKTTLIKKPVTDPAQISALSAADAAVAVSYSDGLGRPIQEVAQKANPEGKDIVNFGFYDAFGRQEIKPLSYTSSSTNYGKFKRDAHSQQPLFYNTLNPQEPYNPYGKTIADDTSLRRLIKTMKPGSVFVGSGVGKTSQMRLNDLSEGVRIWNYQGPGIPVTSTTWGDNKLLVIEGIAEDGKKMLQYKDKEGKLILSKRQATISPSTQHAGWLCTYYVYDEMNRLCHVIPPKATEAVQSGWTLSQVLMDNLCYSYKYDYKGRIIEKKLPGVAPVYIVYDAQDRVVMTQDGNSRIQNDWLFTKYDALGRVVATGRFLNSSGLTHATLLTEIESTSASSNAFVNVLKTLGYGNNYTTSSSISDAEIFTINYFDNYANIPAGYNYDNNAQQALPVAVNQAVYPQSGETMGLLTAGAVRIMDGNSVTSNWESSAIYYDSYGRIIQTQSTNHKGGKDTVTLRYDFSGTAVASLSAQYNPTAVGATYVPLVRILTFNLLDDAGRIRQSLQKVNNEPYWRQISKIEYDPLGRTLRKTIGSTEKQTYSYRMWGALDAINKDYCLNGTGGNFFGEVLNYDYGFGTTYNNGLTAGIKWRLKGSEPIQRAYGYTYDATNKLQTAWYTQNAGNGWSNSQENYTAENMQYDAAGNLTHMDQWISIPTTSAPFKMDNMTYSYMNGGQSNQLKAVDDASSATAGVGEFTEPGQSVADYNYDNNGNITKDDNRNITSIAYNYLNKPVMITFPNNRSITFKYDAAGIKLSKVVTENGVPIITDYLGGLEYKGSGDNPVFYLESIAHAEGRARPLVLNTSPQQAIVYEYDFHVRDHKGNVRSMLTDARDSNWYETVQSGNVTTGTSWVHYDPATVYSVPTEVFAVGNRKYVVTNELALAASEESTFNNVAETRDAKPTSTTATDTKDTRLNAAENRIIGPSVMLRVMGGDHVTIKTQAYYETPTEEPSTVNAEQLVSALITALTGGGSYPTGGEAGVDPSILQEPLIENQFIAAIQEMKNNQIQTGKPQAFLNYLLLDDHFKVVEGQSGFVQTTEPGSWEDLSVARFEAKHSGHLIVFLSNESNMDVHFDNLEVEHGKGKLQEENHYYPFGLTLTSKAIGLALPNNKLYAGKELNRHEFSDMSGLNWYDFGARQQDPQIGVWHNYDPLAEQAWEWSPYEYCHGNPVSFSDPDGMRVRPPEPRNTEFEDIRSYDIDYLGRGHGGGGGIDGALSWLTDVVGGTHGSFLGSPLREDNGTFFAGVHEISPSQALQMYGGRTAGADEAIEEYGYGAGDLIRYAWNHASGEVSMFENIGKGNWLENLGGRMFSGDKEGMYVGFFFGYDQVSGDPLSLDGINGTFSYISFSPNLLRSSLADVDMKDVWPHLVGPALILSGIRTSYFKPIGALGSKSGSSFASFVLRKALPFRYTQILGKKLGQQVVKGIGTNMVGASLGRLIPYVGIALTYAELINAANEYNFSQFKTEGEKEAYMMSMSLAF